MEMNWKEKAGAQLERAETRDCGGLMLASSSSSSSSSLKCSITAVADAALSDLPNILARKVMSTSHIMQHSHLCP
jgi:hypothetical protein